MLYTIFATALVGVSTSSPKLIAEIGVSGAHRVYRVDDLERQVTCYVAVYYGDPGARPVSISCSPTPAMVTDGMTVADCARWCRQDCLHYQEAYGNGTVAPMPLCERRCEQTCKAQP